MVSKRAFYFLFICVLSLHATTMYELSLKNLSTGSDMVVQAKVTAVVKQWNPQKNMIYTYVRMNIRDDLIGDDEDKEIIIKLAGGQIGQTKLFVEGMANYKVGEENMLFLFTDPKNLKAFQTLGMYQGKYELYLDENNVTRVRQSSSGHVKLVSREKGPIEKGNDLTLQEFKTKVLQYIHSAQKERKGE